jgi:hypothetical protein
MLLKLGAMWGNDWTLVAGRVEADLVRPATRASHIFNLKKDCSLCLPEVAVATST